MKKPYQVSFHHGNGIYCSNIAYADDAAAVEAYYGARYDWIHVTDCPPYDLETARRKGMPVFTIDGDERR